MIIEVCKQEHATEKLIMHTIQVEKKMQKNEREGKETLLHGTGTLNLVTSVGVELFKCSAFSVETCKMNSIKRCQRKSLRGKKAKKKWDIAHARTLFLCKEEVQCRV